MSGDNLSANVALNDADYREKLRSLFLFYGDELQELIELATVESNGVRPKNIENEIYSAFHHIYRSIFRDNLKTSFKDIDDAQNSHLLRVQYDAYKIALNASLNRIDKILYDYEFLLIDSDFRAIMPNAVEKFQLIQAARKEIREVYLNAKQCERTGNRQDAVFHYNLAVGKIPELSKIMDDIENDKCFKVAIISIKKKEDREKMQLKITKKWTYISLIAAVASILTLIFNFWSNSASNKASENTYAPSAAEEIAP
jgi:CRISPR/Cas system-associated endoribonuclease Cas2